jgi:hypothetical protein
MSKTASELSEPGKDVVQTAAEIAVHENPSKEARRAASESNYYPTRLESIAEGEVREQGGLPDNKLARRTASRGKEEIRNPNLEIRNKFEIRSTKHRAHPATDRLLSIHIWDFEFVSDFEIRISDLEPERDDNE